MILSSIFLIAGVISLFYSADDDCIWLYPKGWRVLGMGFIFIGGILLFLSRWLGI